MVSPKPALTIARPGPNEIGGASAKRGFFKGKGPRALYPLLHAQGARLNRRCPCRTIEKHPWGCIRRYPA